MRTAFIEQLCELAENDERIWLVCGDLGYSVLEEFSWRFPKRFLNAGVAEQNMTGLAAGLALAGKTVFTYSIANFPVMRCLEQIRNDVCYHNLNVKIVSVGGGLAYGSHGYTHHGVEDIAVMSVMPNMTVVAPGDRVEARCATNALAMATGPAYLRLGKAGEPTLHLKGIDFQIGRSIQIRDGQDITLISTGGMLEATLEAAKQLEAKGYSVRLLSMPTLVPLDAEAIQRAAVETCAILTVEEHGIGGLGSLVAEILAGLTKRVAFYPIRLEAAPIKVAGTQRQLREAQGLSCKGIVFAAEALLPRISREAMASGCSR